MNWLSIVRGARDVAFLKDGSYQVAGNSDTYTITFPKQGAFDFGGQPRCSCPAQIGCRHIETVLFRLEQDARQKAS